MKVVKLTQRKISTNIAVENKETFRISSSDLITKMIQSPGSSQLDELLEIANLNSVFGGNFIQKCLQLRMLIGANDKNFFKSWDLTASMDVMLDDW